VIYKPSCTSCVIGDGSDRGRPGRPLTAQSRHPDGSRRTGRCPPRADSQRGYQASDFMRWDQAGLPKEERAPVRAVLSCRKAVPEGLFLVLSLALRASIEGAQTLVFVENWSRFGKGFSRRRPGPRGSKPPGGGVAGPSGKGRFSDRPISWL
jgi:hypothetical protein